MNYMKQGVIYLGVLTSLLSVSANAELVTVEATGTVSRITNHFGGVASAAVGDTLVLNYTFNTSVPAHRASGTYSYYDSIVSFSYRVNNSTNSYLAFAGPADPVTQLGLGNEIALKNEQGGSVLYLAGANDINSTTNTGVKFALNTYYLWFGAGDPGILANTSITSLPDLAALYAAPNNAGATRATMSISAGNGTFTDSLSVDHLSSLSVIAPVPVPGAIWLLGSGIVGLMATARRQVKRIVS